MKHTWIQTIRPVAAPINSVDMARMRMIDRLWLEPWGGKAVKCVCGSFTIPTRKLWKRMFTISPWQERIALPTNG